MIKLVRTSTISVLFLGTLLAQSVSAEDATPGYNTKIPEGLLTPDKYSTRAGDIEFFDGIPTAPTAEALYNHLDYIRGVQTFLSGVPAASMEAIRRSQEVDGKTNSYQVRIFDELMDSNPLFLTGNTDTVYMSAVLNLQEDGPTVIEIPPGTGPGTVNDAFFRFVIDTGAPGPDAGKGGKYLILPPDYEGDLDPPVGGMEAEVDGETYFVAKSPSWINWFIARGFLKDGKPDFSSKLFRDGVKIYPLAQKDNPPEMEFYDGSTVAYNTIHATDFEFFKELYAVIDREPVEMLDPELRGLFASVGIQKGKPFNPDLRMKNILIKAAEVGNATARTLLWYERNPDDFLYDGSYWKIGFPGGNYEFLRDDGLGGRDLDARTEFFYFATVNTPAMTKELIGKGSQYAWGALDAEGNYLDGSNTYKLNLPKDAPAEKFVSIVLYDPQTRSQLQTSQPFPSYNSEKHKDVFVANDDGSVDLYFGPEAPEGKESNWLETVPGKGFFAILRLYSPTEGWFEKTWRPGDIERLE
ncbi:hypothetical protein GCM10007094_10630 [Pseudovibrio japonicus]|uniref:DUF1254 domain-containing protein n=1 Tax=Pseudovibrio japonicus TaxID=366534 RepID=A0ABQ3E3F4_9HYPH|nr:DUF1254 domain-containing protein [Pseudovibrio japonicus]GHB24456.1 hypothetical protein GCM10007094_10630 [Pseudovibrio japonicus]